MSFFTNNRNSTCCPGPMNGNPMNGLNEKVCIHTQKVFDSGLKQLTLENTTITLENQVPASPTPPLTYIGTTSTTGTTVTNLTIERLADRPNYARVTGNAVIPLVTTYTDSTGVPGSGTSTVSVPFDVILFVPQPSLVPYSVEAYGNAVSTIGTYVTENTFTITLCVTLIVRVVVEADLCVPTYGYCEIPPFTEFSEDQCSGVFELPLYPRASQ